MEAMSERDEPWPAMVDAEKDGLLIGVPLNVDDVS